MLIFHFFYLLVTISAAEISQNSTKICQKCKCVESGDAQSFTLDCSNQDLTKIVENWPSQNPTIKAIFTKNSFASLHELPPTNSTLEIVLSNCDILHLSSGLFTTVPNVKFLDLSHNLLQSEEITSDVFKGPVEDNQPKGLAIEDLNLSYNQIHSLKKNVFEFLPNLTRLNLEGNDFRVLDVQTQLALAKVPGLTSLNLANNELTELVPGAIEHFTNLIEIDLSRNDLDFVPHSLKAVGQTLEILIVDENPIIEITEETFTDLVNLIQISANNLTKIKKIPAGTFMATPKLTKLSLCNNSLQEIDSNAFSLNSTVKELHLTNNNLTKISSNLLDWSQLDTLHLEGNPWICSCDLYTIANALSSSITRNQNGPTCVYPTTGQPHQIYSLESDICGTKSDEITKKKIVYHHFSVPLAGLITMLIIGLFVAVSLAQHRYRKFVQRRLNGPYISQVIYSPLLNARA